MGLNFDLTAQLVFDLAALELLLEDDLEGDYVLGASLPRCVDVPKAAFAELATDLKVVQAPDLLPGSGLLERVEAYVTQRR